MSTQKDITLPLLPDNFYHLYNRGNNNSLIFYNENNYYYFLERYAYYMKAYLETYGYCLLSNHFHLLVKVKPQGEILQTGVKDFMNVSKNFFQNNYPSVRLNELSDDALQDLLNFENLVNLSPKAKKYLPPNTNREDFHHHLTIWAVSERFRRFMLGYSKAINKQEKRKGSLFQKLFRRKLLPDLEDCKNVLVYIHRNEVHHGYCAFIGEYSWSSYQTVLSDKATLLKRDQILEWFGGRGPYIDFHAEYVEDWKRLQKFILEE